MNFVEIKKNSHKIFEQFFRVDNFQKNEYWQNSDLSFLHDFLLQKKNKLKEEKSENILSYKNLKKLEKKIQTLNLNLSEYHYLVLVNGIMIKELSSENFLSQDKKVKINTFDKITSDQDIAYLKKIFYSHAEINDLLLHCNLASSNFSSEFSSGFFFQLTDGVALDKPLLLIHFNYGEKKTPNNNLMVFSLGKKSKMKLVEIYSSLWETNPQFSFFNNNVLLLNLAPKAEVKHFTFQNEKLNNYHTHYTRVILEKKSNYHSHVFQKGSQVGISQKKIHFKAPLASSVLKGLYLATKKQNLDHIIDVEHEKRECTSEQNYLGLIKNHCKTGFTGKVKVYPQAQKTDSSQINKVIMLDKTAIIKSRPQLEIFADDVKCGHGATVGSLDKEQIFYLMSRGIPMKESYGLLCYAFSRHFFNELVKDFPELEKWVESKLNDNLMSLD